MKFGKAMWAIFSILQALSECHFCLCSLGGCFLYSPCEGVSFRTVRMSGKCALSQIMYFDRSAPTPFGILPSGDQSFNKCKAPALCLSMYRKAPPAHIGRPSCTLLVNLDRSSWISRYCGSSAICCSPVSYTHLTLPTKRIV